MGRPIIGITTRRYNLPASGGEIQWVAMGCSLEYPKAVERSGGAPVLLPRTDDADVIASAMDAVDALLLSGGGDIVSLAYGEEPHRKATAQDPISDRMEFEAVRLALAKGLPVLGICRGIQTLNVALGGTLIQDVPSQVPGAIQHSSRERETVLSHTVDIEEGSLLGRVLGTATTPVNSWHHQAVKDLGRGLRVSCRARDGVIEGVEADDGRPVLAVQFHPEDCSDEYPLFRKLFDWLVEQER